jgi:hypothetical protein
MPTKSYFFLMQQIYERFGKMLAAITSRHVEKWPFSHQSANDETPLLFSLRFGPPGL